MATIPSSVNRFQTSSPPITAESGLLVTTVTRRRPIPGHPGTRATTLFPMPKEPEDARLTGGTRSLDRRLLALNLAGSLPMRRVAKPVASERLPAPCQSSAA